MPKSRFLDLVVSALTQCSLPLKLIKVISLDKVAEILNNAKSVKDDRLFPDSDRKGAFKRGWTHALKPDRTYTDETLETRITWQNLGYRFGNELGPKETSEIEEVYNKLSILYRANRGIHDEQDAKDYREGKLVQITSNYYERNREARRACIAHYGPICQICEMDFEQVYGELGRGYIHVHHKEMISKKGGEGKVDFINDLIPVCPNCHAMIHLGNKCRSVKWTLSRSMVN